MSKSPVPVNMRLWGEVSHFQLFENLNCLQWQNHYHHCRALAERALRLVAAAAAVVRVLASQR